jgi:hypothetical protein
MNSHLDNACDHDERNSSRRRFLARAGGGLGMLALAGGLDRESSRAADHVADRPRAKSVIWLVMEGGPSAVDLFDPKPQLNRYDGKRMAGNGPGRSSGLLMKSPFKFERHGHCGAWICEKLPRLARHVDELAFIKSCYTLSCDHGPALHQLNTLNAQNGFPSLGAWVAHGLGGKNQNLPGYVVLSNRADARGEMSNWSEGYLPETCRGTLFGCEGNLLVPLRRPKNVSNSNENQSAQLDLIKRQSAGRERLDGYFKMATDQRDPAESAVKNGTGLSELSRESAATRNLYGLDDPAARRFGTKCLLARRLVERGVPLVQVYSDDPWDAHRDVAGNHGQLCRATDAPIDGLLTDLKQRGLLDSTLVVWGGEFGRLPFSPGNGGRDHNPHGFLTWMAGGGIRGGVSHGETDEIGWKAAVDPTSVDDLHATILHLLGLDRNRLVDSRRGRDVAGRVLTKLLA